MRRALGWCGLLCGILLNHAVAQDRTPVLRGTWAIGLSMGVSSFGAAAEGTTPEGAALRFAPYRPTLWGLELARGKERLRAGVSLRYGQAGLAGYGKLLDDAGGTESILVGLGAFNLYEIDGSLSTRVLRLRGGPALRSSLGVGVELWSEPGERVRAIVGPRGGLGMEVALTRAFVATIEGRLGFTGASPFRQADLPDGVAPRHAWRRTLSAGLSWRF